MTVRIRASRAVAAGLRRWAEGHGPHVRAAVALLIGHEVWLRRLEFHSACLHRDPGGNYWIDWTAARAAFDAGEFGRSSPSERAVLDLAIALAADRYRLAVMSTGKARLIAEAVAAAAGVPLPRRRHLPQDNDVPASAGETETA